MECTCPECKHVFEQKVTRKKKTPKETDPRVTQLIEFFIYAFNSRYGSDPHIAWAACGTLAKRLLKEKTQEELEDIIREYVSCDDKFFKEAGYPFLLLPNYIQKSAVSKKTAWDGMI